MSRRFTLPLASLAICMLASGCVLIPRNVVVMDFENTTGDHRYDGYAKSIPESITTVMNRHPKTVSMLERQDINHYLEEIDRSTKKDERFNRFQQLGKRLEADYLVLVSVAKFGELLVVQCRLFSVETGKIIPASSEAFRCNRHEEIPDMIDLLGKRMVDEVSARSAGG